MSGRPEVIVDVVFEDGLLFLTVANIGDRPALDVKTTFNRKLVGLGGTKDVAALPLFANIPFLAPGKEIRTLLDSTASWFSRRGAKTVVARVDAHDTTAPFRYLRFRDPPYDEAALAGLAETVRPLLADGTDVYGFFRHEDEPTAPLYAERLRELVGE